MTDDSLIETLKTVAALATLAGIVFNTIKLSRTEKNVQTIKLATDGMKDALVAATATGEFAKGNLQGREQQTAERALDNPTGATVETVVVNAVEKVASKSLDKVATTVADKVAKKMTEKKPR